jgi:hypothetical protein
VAQVTAVSAHLRTVSIVVLPVTSLTLTRPTAPAAAREPLGRRLASRLAFPAFAVGLATALALYLATAVALLLWVV